MTDAVAEELERKIAALRERVETLRSEVEASFLGHREVVDLLFYALLADGHALLENPPRGAGLGVVSGCLGVTAKQHAVVVAGEGRDALQRRFGFGFLGSLREEVHRVAQAHLGAVACRVL